MSSLSYSEYYTRRLAITTSTITNKKRKYEEAMGYPNDYLVVQEPDTPNHPCSQWCDAYLENLCRPSLSQTTNIFKKTT
jgi:hypothetical protein